MISITVGGVAYSVPSSAADKNWAAAQVAFEQALAAALAPPTWTTVPNGWFSNGWSGTGFNGHGNAQYTRDAAGWVSLRGIVVGGTPDVTAITLPTGYRPPHSVSFWLTNLDDTTTEAIIASDGTIQLSGSDAVDGAELCAIRFSTTT